MKQKKLIFKWIKRLVLSIPVVFSPLFFIIIIAGGLAIGTTAMTQQSMSKTGNVVGNTGLSNEVKQYEPLVTRLATQYQMQFYVPYLLAIMQVESGGVGRDVMQASESKGLAPNSIETPEESIIAGIEHLKNILSDSKTVGVDFWTTIAAYNYGRNYVNFISKRGGTHTLALSEEYSKTVVAPSLGNHTAETYKYSNKISRLYQKEYLYRNGGNFFYVELVKQYLVFSDDSIGNGIISTGLPLADWDDVVITSRFGYRYLFGKTSFHQGVDFVYKDGRIDSPIYSIGEGVVVYADNERGGGGNTVIVKHQENYYSYYMHLKSFSVSKGDTISKGQQVGIMGNTGRSTGTHLHLGISKNYWSDYIDPLKELNLGE